MLPYFNSDYVILTPKDILTKDENWINQNDLVSRFEDIARSIPNTQLRSTVSNYFHNRLVRDDGKEASKKDRREAALETLKDYPFLVDFYIQLKEETGNEARSVNDERLMFVQTLFNEAVRQLTDLLPSGFYDLPAVGTYEDAHRRLAYQKSCLAGTISTRQYAKPGV